MFEAKKNGSALSEKKLPLTNNNKKYWKKMVDSELRIGCWHVMKQTRWMLHFDDFFTWSLMTQVLFEFQVSKIKLRLQKLIWSQQRPSIMQRRFTIRPGPHQNVCYPNHHFQYHNLWKGIMKFLFCIIHIFSKIIYFYFPQRLRNFSWKTDIYVPKCWASKKFMVKSPSYLALKKAAILFMQKIVLNFNAKMLSFKIK